MEPLTTMFWLTFENDNHHFQYELLVWAVNAYRLQMNLLVGQCFC
jgi:hypothetical protein